MTVQHPSCPTLFFFYFGDFFAGRWGQSGKRAAWGQVSTATVNLQSPLQLNTLFHRHGSSEALFPGGRGECGRECETARGRERANKFSENTVIQYGRHCAHELTAAKAGFSVRGDTVAWWLTSAPEICKGGDIRTRSREQQEARFIEG